MKLNIMSRNITCLLLLVIVCSAFAEDWTRWRGPDGNGITAEKGWNEKGLARPRIKWRADVGNGYASVSVGSGLLYTMGADDDVDTVYCLDAETGKEQWTYSYKCRDGSYPGTRATPVIDGDKLYTFSRRGHVHCLDRNTGKVRWMKDITDLYGAEVLTWGFASSPMIVEEKLVLNAGSHGVALDKTTGEKIWASPPGTGNYASPVVYEVQGGKRAAIFGKEVITGVDLETGRKLWSYDWDTRWNVNAADPVISDGLMFISSGYGKGCGLFDVSRDKPALKWKSRDLCSHFSSAVIIKDHVYGVDGNAGRGKLCCLELATGKAVWKEKLGFGSFIVADGRVVYLTERGHLSIGVMSPRGYRELSSAGVIDGKGKCWTAPVLANGLVYCRSSKGALVCVDLRK